GGRTFTGTTDAEGKVTASIPAGEHAAVTIAGERGSHSFTLHLEPGLILLPLAPVVIVQQAPEPALVAIQFHAQEQEGKPYRSRPFEIVAAGQSISGTTDAEGVVTASIPGAARARITVQGEQGAQSWTLHVEHLRSALPAAPVAVLLPIVMMQPIMMQP